MSRSTTWVWAAACAAALGWGDVREARAMAESPWDQAAVSAIAKEFSESMDAVDDIIRKEPAVAAQATNFHRLKQYARRIKQEARHLETMLAKGEGHDETVGVYENLVAEIERARVTASKVYVTASVSERVAAARSVLMRLAPYYDAERPPERLPL
jgi:hypothetical protein